MPLVELLLCSLQATISTQERVQTLVPAPTTTRSPASSEVDPDGDRFLLWVQEARTGFPAEGVEVRWFEERKSIFDPDEEWWFDELAPRDRPISDEVSEHPLGVALTDSTGAAFIPMNGIEWMRVEARKADLVGRTWRSSGSEGVERIDLVRTFDLEVRVLDERGEPVSGVPVALRGSSDTGKHDVLEASTSDSGTATLQNAGFAMTNSDWLENWSVSLDLCLAAEVEVPIDPTNPPTGPIQLVLPPTGEVEVVLRNADGSEGDSPDGVVLAVRTGQDWKDGKPRLGYLEGSTPVGPGGRARFRFVGLGTTLVAFAQQNRASRMAGAALWGPTRAGQCVQVVVGLGWRSVELHGRVVDEKGAPVANTKLFVELFSGPPRRDDGKVWINASRDGLVLGSRGTACTDERGMLRLDYEPEDLWEGVPQLLLSRGHDEANPLACSVDLLRYWRTGYHDLGDIVLRPAPILAAGRVVDDLGAPVPDASVDIFPCKGARMIRGQTDKNGMFLLRGAEPLPDFDVSARKEGYAHAARWGVLPGTADLSIEIPREAVIEGQIVVAPKSLDTPLSVSLFWKDGEHSSMGSTEPVTGRRFRFAGLRAGQYQMTVTWAEREPIVRQHELHAGETLRLEISSTASFEADAGPGQQ